MILIFFGSNMENYMKHFQFIIISILFITNYSLLSAKEDLEVSTIENNPNIVFRYLHPTLPGKKQFTLLSGAYDISVLIPVSPKWGINARLPFSTYTYNEDTESSIGCISIGFNYDSKDRSPFIFNGNIFLPTIPREKRYLSMVSASSNLYELSSYLYGGIFLNPSIEKRYDINDRFYIGLGIGNMMLIPTVEGIDEIETYFNYCFKMGFDKINAFGIEMMLGGLFFASSDSDDKFVHFLRLSIQYRFRDFVPKLYFYMPLDEKYSNSIDNLFGLEFTFNIK